VRIIFLILLLTYFSWVFLLIFAIGFVLIVFIQKFIYKKLTEVREKERKLNEEYTKQTAKIFMNFILLKIAHLKQKELEKLYQIGINRINNYVWLKFWFSAGARFMNVFLTVVFIGVLIYFAKLYFE
jgi:predicted small secreted protein